MYKKKRETNVNIFIIVIKLWKLSNSFSEYLGEELFLSSDSFEMLVKKGTF